MGRHLSGFDEEYFGRAVLAIVLAFKKSYETVRLLYHLHFDGGNGK